MDTKIKRHLGLVLGVLFVVSACAGQTPSTAPSAASEAPSSQPSESASAPAESASPSPLAADPAEAVITNIEPNATISVWTFWLSPTFDEYIKDTIDRFKETYPGVKVKWEDHQATFQDDLKNAFAAGNAPDVINLSVSEGWVSDYATQGPPAAARRQRPAGRQGHLLPGPLEGAAGRRQELPVPVVPGPQRRADQQADLRGRPASTPPTSRRRSRSCRPCARPSRTRPGRVCDIRLTVNDLLAQMVYEGNVEVINDAGKPSPSTRPTASPGSRCTSTWSRPAPSTTPS